VRTWSQRKFLPGWRGRVGPLSRVLEGPVWGIRARHRGGNGGFTKCRYATHQASSSLPPDRSRVCYCCVRPVTEVELDSSGEPNWARWFSLLVGLFALVALGVTLYTVGFATIGAQLAIIGWWFVAIVALEVGSAFADAAVIHGFLGSGGRRPRFLRVLKAQVTGRSINLVTPMASLGEATKVTMLMRNTSGPRAVAAIVRFNLSYIAVNLLSVVIGAPICALALSLPRWLDQLLWIGSAVSVMVVAGIVLLLRAGLVSSLIRALHGLRFMSSDRSQKLRKRLQDIDRSLRGDRGWRSWLPASWALVSKIFGWIILWIVMNANGQPPSLGVLATMASAGTLIGVVANVAPMGIGLSEAGTAALMSALGQGASLGVTTVLARRVIQICYAAVGLLLLASSETVPIKRKKS
jgi:uncharacterized membrane protein YbhN (UPF0104 family)